MALYGNETGTATGIDEYVANGLVKQLQTLGFKPDQSKKAVASISEPSAFMRHFTENLSPLEACIEYLLLHTPEVDLPARFMPTNNSSNAFITDAHSSTENLQRRWFEEAIVKEGGWPLYLVREELAVAPSGIDHPETLVSNLGVRLLGGARSFQAEAPALGDVDPAEVDAYGGTISPGRATIPLPISPFTLHIFTPTNVLAVIYPPAVHISSPSIPPYVRLHILSHILRAVDEGHLKDAGETFVGACLRTIEEEWANIEDNGQPDVAQVLKHIAPNQPSEVDERKLDEDSVIKPGKRKEHCYEADNRTDEQVRTAFKNLCTNRRYQEILASRKRLPAFSAREEFLSVLGRSRVVVVVGETGNIPSRRKTK